MTMRDTSLTLVFFLLLAGCATQGVNQKTLGKSGSGKQKEFVDQFSVVSASAPGGKKANCTPESDGQSLSGKELVARAHQCVREKNWKSLESLGNSIAQVKAESPWGAYFLSVAAEGVGNLPRAMWMIELSQKKAGKPVGLFLYQRGRIWLEMKDTTAGLVDLEKAVDLEPGLVDGHLYIAEVYHRDLDLAKAQKHYEQALHLDPKSLRALGGLAEIHIVKEAGGPAAELYSRYVDLDPNQMKPWLRLAWIQESLQKNNELALNSYTSLKRLIDKGSIREKPSFDLSSKIKSLETAVRTAAPVKTEPASGTQRSIK